MPVPDSDDPDEILRVLPEKYREYFLSEYTPAARDAAQHPEVYRHLRELLRLWRLRAAAYSDPGYEDRLAAALEGRDKGVPIEEVIPDWHEWLRRRGIEKAHLPPGSDPDGLDLLASGSLPAAWNRHFAFDPSRPLLHLDPHGWVTRGHLDQASRRVAARLHAAGLSPGDRVVTSAATSLELVVAYVAALRLGLVVVPANPAYSQPELAHVISDAQPRAVLVDDPGRGDWARQVGSGGLLVLDPRVDLPEPAGDPPPVLDAANPWDPALLVYTSGTTGKPKGAVLSHGNLLAGAEALRVAWRWTEADRLLLALPLFHVHGLAVGLHGTLLAGATAVLQPRFDVRQVLDAARAHDATMFFGVPTMYTRLVGSADTEDLSGSLGGLRLCVSGSAPLPASVLETFEAATGQRILERYGMSETLMNVSNPYEGERRPGTVGLPLPGVQVRLTEGDHGEILLRGPNVFSGYWRNPEATADAFTPDGWFRSGDLARLDADGYVRIEGRVKELIITGGFNVSPREVEEALLTHPGVAEAAVVGAPSAEWGETVVAFVVPAGPPPPVEVLRAAAAERLAPYKRPREVRYVAALPRNAMGKVLRHELRAQLTDQQEPADTPRR